MCREVFVSLPNFPRWQYPYNWCITKAKSWAHSGPTAPHTLVCTQAGAYVQLPAHLFCVGSHVTTTAAMRMFLSHRAPLSCSLVALSLFPSACYPQSLATTILCLLGTS